MLFVALSCLQGRGQWEAAQELLQLPVDGLQLTPGNDNDWTQDSLEQLASIRTNRHQGHSFDKRVARVYDNAGALVWTHGSVHAHSNWRSVGEAGITVETMYPNGRYPYALMTTAEYYEAIELQTPIALDLSHADICINKGLLTAEAARKLLYLGNVQELHVSFNDGRHDTHIPMPPDYHWVEQAEWFAQTYPDRPVVIECYMHKLTPEQRLAQVEIFKHCRKDPS